jgi:flagellar motor switch protein FliG
MSTTVTEASKASMIESLVLPSASDRPKVPGIRKAAVFLSQLSSEEAGAVFSKMRTADVEAVTAEIMRLRSVDPEDANEVVVEFHTMMQARQFVGQGGAEFAREVLAAGLGRDRADEILQRLDIVFTEMPFSALRTADIRQMVTFLKDEHPQIIALVLVHLPSAQSADVLSRLAPEAQADVAMRIATMDRTAPEMVRMVEEELSRRMGSVLAHQDMTTVGGVSSLVEIINRSDRSAERSILEWLEAQDPELAERVRSQMFVFEDIVSIDDRSMQTLLRDVSIPDLACALKGVRDDVQDKVLRNLSERAGETLAEETDLLGPVRMKVVEEAQARIVQAIRALEASGDITLSRGGEDEFVA